MHAQWDPDRNQYILLDDIIDFRKTNPALFIEDRNIVVKGRASLCFLTVGWKVFCQWKDGLTYWEKLSYLKESNPVKTAEYAHHQGISHEPAFNWWAPSVLKKRDRIISLVRKRNPRYLKKTHKFGIEVLTTVAEVLVLYMENGDTHWDDGIASAINIVKVSFYALLDG